MMTWSEVQNENYQRLPQHYYIIIFISFVFAVLLIFNIFEHISYAGYYFKILNAFFIYISLLCTEVDLQAH